MVPIQLNHFVFQHPEQVNSLLQDGIMFLSLENNGFYSANPMALKIWSIIESKTRVESLIQTLLSRYDVDEDEIREDVLNFLGKMAEYQLIKVE